MQRFTLNKVTSGFFTKDSVLKIRLIEGLSKLEVQLSDEQHMRLLGYVELLDKWNKVYNLTAVREPEAMLTQHILDSLAMVKVVAQHFPVLSSCRILDVGSGAGLPAVPLAIACPEWQVTALDGHHKRTAFVQQVAIELGLPNLEVVQERVESWKPAALYDVVISRAFAELSDFVTLSGQHLAKDGIMVAMKGVYPYEELERLSSFLVVKSVQSLEVPFLSAQRHAVILAHSA